MKNDQIFCKETVQNGQTLTFTIKEVNLLKISVKNDH